MEGKGYIKSLDGIRAFAILLVMTFHAEITHFGWIGVQLFFVLSGFLITGILWKEKDHPGTLFFKFKKFWVRRSLRIFPLYYGYVLLIGAAFLLFRFPSYYPSFFPYLISYTSNFPYHLLENTGNPLFNHLWSLAIEEQFYLFFPFIILLLPKKAIRFLLIAVILFSPLLRYFVGEHYRDAGSSLLGVSNAVNFNPLCQLDAFCFGGIIPVLGLDKRITRPLLLFLLSGLLVIVAGIVNYKYSGSAFNFASDLGFNHYLISNYQHVWHYSVLNVFFASCILFLVSAAAQGQLKWLRRITEHPAMIRVGKVSYGMYLFHWLIWVYVFTKWFPPETMYTRIALFIPYVFAVYLAATVSYRFYESPFLLLKDKLFPPKK